MKRLAGLLTALALVMLAGSPVTADDDVKKPGAKKEEGKKPGEKKGKRPPKRPTVTESTLKRLEGVELTETQKEQIQKIAAEFEPKLQAARKKVTEATPEDQRKARREALAKAKAEGKKPNEVLAAFKATPEQQAAQKEAKELFGAFNQKVNEVLTKEQKQTLRKSRKGAGEKKPGEKKPREKKLTKEAKPE